MGLAKNVLDKFKLDEKSVTYKKPAHFEPSDGLMGAFINTVVGKNNVIVHADLDKGIGSIDLGELKIPISVGSENINMVFGKDKLTFKGSEIAGKAVTKLVEMIRLSE